MSVTAIRAAFEIDLAAMTPALATMYENVPFTPKAGEAYQRVQLVPAEPLNETFGDDVYQERGFFQVLLCYPQGVGAGDAFARAKAIQDRYYRGRTLQNASVKVVVSGTPSIHAALTDGDRFCVPVRVRYFSHVGS